LLVSGQGEFLHRGQSGVQLDGFFLEAKRDIHVEDNGTINSKNATLTGYGGKFGFCLRGVFDMQWSINAWSLPSTSLYPDTKGTTVTARLVVHALKQSDKIPFSVRGLFGYSFSEYDATRSSQTDIPIGLGIYRRIYLRDNISFNPTIDLVYSISEYSFDQADDTIDESGTQVAIVIPIAFNLMRNHLIHLAPFINYGIENSEGSYGINVGYILPFYARQK
jgi:hypothetical protein